MKKGITPIISIIVLLLITVALAGVAWTYLNQNLLVRTEKAMEVPFGGAWCDVGGAAYVTIANVGTGLIEDGDFQTTVIGNNTAVTVVDIPVKESRVFNDGSTAHTAGEDVNYRFVAGGSVVHGTITCA